MRKTWRTLGVMLTLSVAACTGCNDNGSDGDGNGTEDNIVCTGAYSGGATGKVKFCSLSALRTSDGSLQYTLSIEPDTSGTVVSNDNLSLFAKGDPKTGTFALDTFTDALSRVSVQGDKDYQVVRSGGEQFGNATLTIETVPSGTNLAGNNVKYDNFVGKAEIQYVPPPGADYTDTVTLKLSFQRQ
ncbi:hypothetical protein [Melittangium boletus]|uniref:Lipoprotein n=1 Tax=Melittangium boletus DSM 14713 TaxID=1294270 RepID=A0A250IE95_9BACT|nr:hypothetical protein [Melittangium boletus]ATB29461.1 hypothetical protein MEBOL_002911 [Melittangium boletus DSM 14713]